MACHGLMGVSLSNVEWYICVQVAVSIISDRCRVLSKDHCEMRAFLGPQDIHNLRTEENVYKS